MATIKVQYDLRLPALTISLNRNRISEYTMKSTTSSVRTDRLNKRSSTRSSWVKKYVAKFGDGTNNEDQVYYENEETGETTWDRPSELGDIDEDSNGDGDNIEDSLYNRRSSEFENEKGEGDPFSTSLDLGQAADGTFEGLENELISLMLLPLPLTESDLLEFDPTDRVNSFVPYLNFLEIPCSYEQLESFMSIIQHAGTEEQWDKIFKRYNGILVLKLLTSFLRDLENESLEDDSTTELSKEELKQKELEFLETRVLVARIVLIIEKVYQNCWKQVNAILRVDGIENSDIFKYILGTKNSTKSNLAHANNLDIIIFDITLDALSKIETYIDSGGVEEEIAGEDALVWIMFITSYLTNIELLNPLIEHKEYPIRLMGHMFSIYEWLAFGNGGNQAEPIPDLCCYLVIALNRCVSQDPNRVMLSILLYLQGEDIDEENRLRVQNSNSTCDIIKLFSENFIAVKERSHRINVMEALLNQLNDMGYPNQMDMLPWLLKLLQDMLNNESVSRALYVNDIRVLVDIILRELAALPSTEPAVNDFLCLLENVLLSRLWTEYAAFYRKNDIKDILLAYRQQVENSPETLGDNKETVSFLVETILEETADYIF